MSRKDHHGNLTCSFCGKGQREVQVLYSEPGGREIYLFTDNRLSRIVRPGQG